MVKVLIKKLDPKVKLPIYKTEGSSGMDLMAFTDNPIKIPAIKYLIFSFIHHSHHLIFQQASEQMPHHHIHALLSHYH